MMYQINYNKRNLSLYSLFFLAMTLVSVVVLYDQIFYDELGWRLPSGDVLISMKEYVPFSFPASLWRVNGWVVGCFVIVVFVYL